MYPCDDFGKRIIRLPNIASPFFFLISANMKLVSTMDSVHSTVF